jgi:hypothetical protein
MDRNHFSSGWWMRCRQVNVSCNHEKIHQQVSSRDQKYGLFNPSCDRTIEYAADSIWQPLFFFLHHYPGHRGWCCRRCIVVLHLASKECKTQMCNPLSCTKHNRFYPHCLLQAWQCASHTATLFTEKPLAQCLCTLCCTQTVKKRRQFKYDVVHAVVRVS